MINRATRRMMLVWSLLFLSALLVTAFVPPQSGIYSSSRTRTSLAARTNSVQDNDDASWNSKYSLLKQFRDQFGHIYVPRNWGDPQLKDWVQEQVKLVQLANDPNQNQQQVAFSTTMTPDRLRKLAAVGIEAQKTSNTNASTGHAIYPIPPMFVQDPMTGQKLYACAWEQRWEDMYEKLVAFKKRHNGFVNCNTKKGYNLDMRLAEWVQIQRENLRLGVMRSDRQSKLEAIGLEPLPSGVY